MTEADYPEWPGRSWATKEEAIVAAVDDSDPGDEIVVHQHGCARQFDEDCNCKPEVILVNEGKA